MLWEWELNDNAVNGWVIVQGGNGLEKLGLGCGVGEVDEFAIDASLDGVRMDGASTTMWGDIPPRRPSASS